MSPIQVSIVIVNYNGAEVVLNCLSSIFQHLDSANIEVIVVDNASQDGSPELIAQSIPRFT